MTEEQKNREIEQMAKLLRKYLIEENGGMTIDELARRLVDEGVKPSMPKLLGDKKCKDFHGDCSSCPLTYLNDCYLDNDDNSNYTLFEIIEYKKEDLDYLYEPIMAKLNEEVIDLPEQRFINVNINETKYYKKFMRDSVVTVGDKEFVGDTTSTKLLYARVLSGVYNQDKLDALADLIDSTDDRLVIFYNFKDELDAIKSIIHDKPISEVNGSVKDLMAYNEHSNSIILVQYQAGATGVNLQKANKIIYFSPTLSSELYEQSKKRIHRIGQGNKCLYYKLVSGIEHHIYKVLDLKKDYTDKLFEEIE